MAKRLGDLTLSEVQSMGYPSMVAFVSAWIDEHGYWDPTEVLENG